MPFDTHRHDLMHHGQVPAEQLADNEGYAERGYLPTYQYDGSVAWEPLGDHDHDADYEPLGSVATHAGLPDPHPGYLTPAEGDAAYDPIGAAAAAQAAAEATAAGALSSHAGTASAHHTRYADSEAVSAMGAKDDANPLHHDRYTDAEALAATAAAYEAAGAIATHASVVDAHHARYTDAEAVTAMGAKGDANPLHHDRLTLGTTPSTQAFGDAAAGGSATTASKNDHKHAMMADPTTNLRTIDYLVGTASGELSAEIVVGTTPGGELGGTWASPTVDATHSGSTHAATQAAAEATAAGALASHVSAGDPHTGYRLESADHSHQSTGAQAGQLDHGLALTGLGDDDHTQYLLADGSRVADPYLIIRRDDGVQPVLYLDRDPAPAAWGAAGEIRFRGGSGGAQYEVARIVASTAGQVPASGDSPGYLAFYSTPDGSGTPTDRWHVRETGRLEPATDSAYDIGTSSLRVRTGYFDEVDVGESMSVLGYKTSWANDTNGDYTKVASWTFNAQYQDVSFTLHCQGSLLSTAHPAYIVYVRSWIWASGTPGAAVYVTQTGGSSTATDGQFVVVFTSVAGYDVTAELYYKYTNNYEGMYFSPLMEYKNCASLAFYTNQTYSASLPAGTQVAGVFGIGRTGAGHLLPGADSTYNIGTSSNRVATGYFDVVNTPSVTGPSTVTISSATNHVALVPASLLYLQSPGGSILIGNSGYTTTMRPYQTDGPVHLGTSTYRYADTYIGTTLSQYRSGGPTYQNVGQQAGSANTSGNWLHADQFYGSTGAGTGIGAAMVVVGDGTWSGSSYPTRLEWRTAGADETSTSVRWRIYGAGSLQPGADSAYDIGSSSVRPANIYADALIAPFVGYDSTHGVNINSSGDLLPYADGTHDLGSASYKWADLHLSGATVYLGDAVITAGDGSPEGVITAPVGSMYLCTDAAEGYAVYFKQSGSGDTGWEGVGPGLS